jgi:hypothetical protein
VLELAEAIVELKLISLCSSHHMCLKKIRRLAKVIGLVLRLVRDLFRAYSSFRLNV